MLPNSKWAENMRALCEWITIHIKLFFYKSIFDCTENDDFKSLQFICHKHFGLYNPATASSLKQFYVARWLPS